MAAPAWVAIKVVNDSSVSLKLDLLVLPKTKIAPMAALRIKMGTPIKFLNSGSPVGKLIKRFRISRMRRGSFW